MTTKELLGGIPIKKILIGICVAVTVYSIGSYLWTGLGDWINKTEELNEQAKIQMVGNAFQRGLIIGANNIIQQIKNGAKVNFNDGVIEFVPKP
ncbi:hypothetical protein KAR91_03710 [Candidatus Pacearchaeota archaeon]|nr:hypothetical protein [Candidatus Pacearchaeota archaeon]